MRIGSSSWLKMIGAVWVVLFTVVSGYADAVYSIFPTNVLITPGQSFTTETRVATWNNSLGAFSLLVEYDPQVIHILSVSLPSGSVFTNNFCADTSSFQSGQTRIVGFRTDSSSHPQGETAFVIGWQTVGTNVSQTAITNVVEASVDSSFAATEVVSFGSGAYLDSDADSIPDWWMMQYFGHLVGQASDNSLAQDSAAGDGVSNLQKYLHGKNPLVWDNLHFVGTQPLPGGQFRLTLFGQVGHNYLLQASTDLVNWVPIFAFGCTNGTMDVFDLDAGNFSSRFYRLAPLTQVPAMTLGLGSETPLGSDGLNVALFSLPGLNYRIEASSDFVSWTPITNFLSTNAAMYLLDPSATNYSQRFYRAVAP